MNKNILKTLTDSLDIDDETLSEITSDTILFGPMSKMGFDSIDAMAYICLLYTSPSPRDCSYLDQCQRWDLIP